MGNCDQSAYLNRKKENALANIKVKETSSSAEIHVQKSEKEKTSMKEDSLIPDLNAFQSQKQSIKHQTQAHNNQPLALQISQICRLISNYGNQCNHLECKQQIANTLSSTLNNNRKRQT